MATIKLIHNDDATLDPADPSLRQRGALHIDGRERGTWESHRDGRWTAFVDGEPISAATREELIGAIEKRARA